MLPNDDAIPLTAPCKINLNLEILGRRDNGYHDIRTLMLPLPEPHDTLEITKGKPGNGPVFSCDRPELETPSNLVAKALRAHCRATGFWPDIQVRLIKRIPVGAGLGGGSSDAARVLAWINREAGSAALSSLRLKEMAASLGADVPFFLLDGPAWATGIGDRLEPTSVDLAEYVLVLVCPGVPVSTAWAYKAWDAANARAASGRFRDSLTGLRAGTIHTALLGSAGLWNSFENVVYPAHPELRHLKEQLLASGAAAALLTGSGSGVFALFKGQAEAARAARAMDKEDRAVFVHRF